MVSTRYLAAALALAVLLLALPQRAQAHTCVHDAIMEGVQSMFEAQGPTKQTYRRTSAAELASLAEEAQQLGEQPRTAADGATVTRIGSRTLLQSSVGGIGEVEEVYEPLRIVLDFTYLRTDVEDRFRCDSAGEQVITDSGGTRTCTAADVLSPEKNDTLRTLLEVRAAGWLSSALLVRPVSGNLRLSRGWTCGTQNYVCCATRREGGVNVAVPSFPAAALAGGIPDADFVLYITARPTTGTTLAWALPCQFDQFSRPIAGHANFGPQYLPGASASEQTLLEVGGTATHEITHVLGMSSSQFTNFREPNNGPRRGINNVVAQAVERGHAINKMVTPTVAAWVKAHFGCEDWPGAGGELEEYGGSGSAGSHWDRRIFGNDFMTATAVPEPILSGLTLAALQDSGWYRINTAAAQPLRWGAGEGCSFARGSCAQWPTRYRCSSPSTYSCTADHAGKASCSITQFGSTLPSQFQYFTGQPALGGRDPFGDFCPTWSTIYSGDDASGNRQYIDCRGPPFGGPAGVADSRRWLRSELAEETGDASTAGACFHSNYAPSGSSPSEGQTCHRYSCALNGDGTGYTLTVMMAGELLTCPQAGGPVNAPAGFDGTLECPPARLLCAVGGNCPGGCSGAGTCRDGVCTCLPGRTGLDCGAFACPTAINGTVCSGAGACDGGLGVCSCDPGAYGADCSATTPLACPVADCSGHGSCDGVHGVCTCESGFAGAGCATAVARGGRTYTDLQPNVDATGQLAAGQSAYFAVPVASNRADVAVLLTAVGDAGSSAETVEMAASFLNGAPTPGGGAPDVLEGGPDTPIVICGVAGDSAAVRGEGALRCETGLFDQAFFPAGGVLHIAVVASGSNVNDTFYTLRASVSSSCTPPNCNNRGDCVAGSCSCVTGWSGDSCDVPDCPGTPDCLGRGSCDLASDNTPFCNCTAGWGGRSCELRLDDGEQPPPEGQLARGDWTYYELNVDRLPWAVVVQLTSTTPRAAPMLLARSGDLPTLSTYDAFDAEGFAAGATTQRLVLDSANGLRDGLLFVAVHNSAFAEETLQFDITFTEGAGCPADLSACSGHGSCAVITSGNAPTCRCDAGYFGDACERQAMPLPAADAVQTLDAKQSALYAVPAPAAGTTLWTVTIQAASEGSGSVAEGASPMLSVGLTQPPTLTSASALRDFAAVGSSRQTVALVGGQLSGNMYVAVFNRPGAEGPLAYTISTTATTAATAGQLVNSCTAISGLDAAAGGEAGGESGAAAGASSEATASCSGHGTCASLAGEAACQCDDRWSGALCASPLLPTASALFSASSALEDMDADQNAALQAGGVKLYRVDLSDAKKDPPALTVDIKSDDADADILLAPAAPRAPTVFTQVVATAGTEEAAELPLQAGNTYYIALYARSPGLFEVQSNIDEVIVKYDTPSLLDRVGELTGLGVIIAVLTACTCLGLCCGKRKDPGAKYKAMEMSAAKPAYPPKLPRGWQMVRTADGNICFINHQTRTSRWDPPPM